MSQLPFAVFIFPEMRRPELIAQVEEIFGIYLEVFHDLFKIPLRKLSIEASD
ncbi:MAG: hypothetical protein HYU33_03935 [Candidatus Omnitrophica bacterium]|nr:hypothetical protein [Candidatus Omnitrophota bacterium]